MQSKPSTIAVAHIMESGVLSPVCALRRADSLVPIGTYCMHLSRGSSTFNCLGRLQTVYGEETYLQKQAQFRLARPGSISRKYVDSRLLHKWHERKPIIVPASQMMIRIEMLLLVASIREMGNGISLGWRL